MTHTFVEGQQVLFNAQISGSKTVCDGTVASVHPDRREVHIHFMIGLKDAWQMTSYDDVLAVHDKTAPYMRIANYSGPMIDLRPNKAKRKT